MVPYFYPYLYRYLPVTWPLVYPESYAKTFIGGYKKNKHLTNAAVFGNPVFIIFFFKLEDNVAVILQYFFPQYFYTYFTITRRLTYTRITLNKRNKQRKGKKQDVLILMAMQIFYMYSAYTLPFTRRHIILVTSSGTSSTCSLHSSLLPRLLSRPFTSN